MIRPGVGLLLALGLVLAGPSVSSGEPISIQVEPGERNGTPVAAQLSLTSDDPAAQPLTRAVKAPGEVTFDLPGGSRWNVTVSAAGYWSKPLAMTVPGGGDRLGLKLWPAGRLHGEVRVAPGEPAPREISLHIQSSPGAPAANSVPQATVLCPVADRKWSCELPAGVLDIRLRAQGFVSHYLWGAKVLRGAESKSLVIALQRGASVVGWIAAPEGDFRYGECQVELAAQSGGLASRPGDLERRSVQVMNARVNARGFFQISGVPAGSFRLTVRHPRYAPSHVAPVYVVTGSETEIRRIELHPPVDLEVSLQPAGDAFLGRWSLVLQRAGEIADYFAPAAEGLATVEGLWKATGLEPGLYLLRVRDTRGSQWVSQEIEIGTVSTSLEVDAKFTRVQGTVTLGSEPLAATLWFGGKNGPRSIRTKSDEEGKFYVFLSWETTWDVDVEADEPRIASRLTGLKVEPRRGAAGVMDIALPATRLSVEVVDEEGRPAPQARVRAVGPTPREILLEPVDNAEARLELLGLSPGRWLLSGEGSSRDGAKQIAETVAVELREEQEATARLVLLRSRKLAGMVVSPLGVGVPGAQVIALLDGQSGLPHLAVPSAVTDVDGRFELNVPSASPGPVGTRSPRLTVLAPGFALQQLPPHTPEEGPLVVYVEQAGGTIILDGQGQLDFLDPSRRLPVLFGRHALWIQLAYSWARLHGAGNWEGADRLVIPMLEPGPYTACWSAAETSAAEPPIGRSDLCASGVLAPHGKLVLKLPRLASTAGAQ